MATLEECLEFLGILLCKSGAQPSVAFSCWRLARSEVGDATGRGHRVHAECLEILNILEKESKSRPRPSSSVRIATKRITMSILLHGIKIWQR